MRLLQVYLLLFRFHYLIITSIVFFEIYEQKIIGFSGSHFCSPFGEIYMFFQLKGSFNPEDRSRLSLVSRRNCFRKHFAFKFQNKT